jgi:hypothetical protein
MRNIAIAIIVGIFLGAVGMYYLGPKQVVKEPVAESMMLHTTLEGKKEIVYVEKEPGEKTDVQIYTAKPVVTVSVNGQQQQFQLKTLEGQKFEKGKLVITEQTQLRLDIKVPQPRYLLGLGWGSNGLAGNVVGRINDYGSSWWIYGDRRTLAGGLSVPLGK